MDTALSHGEEKPAQPAKVRKAWCDVCGALPDDEVKPKIIGLAQGDLLYEMPCSVRGCTGAVRMKGWELRLLARGGLIAELPKDLDALRSIQTQALEMLGPQPEGKPKVADTDRIGAGRLALAVAKEKLKMAGMLVEAPTTAIQVNQQFNYEPGDVIDEELDEMFEGKDALVVEPVPPEPKTPTDVHPPADDGGWM